MSTKQEIKTVYELTSYMSKEFNNFTRINTAHGIKVEARLSTFYASQYINNNINISKTLEKKEKAKIIKKILKIINSNRLHQKNLNFDKATDPKKPDEFCKDCINDYITQQKAIDTLRKEIKSKPYGKWQEVQAKRILEATRKLQPEKYIPNDTRYSNRLKFEDLYKLYTQCKEKCNDLEEGKKETLKHLGQLILKEMDKVSISGFFLKDNLREDFVKQQMNMDKIRKDMGLTPKKKYEKVYNKLYSEYKKEEMRFGPATAYNYDFDKIKSDFNKKLGIETEQKKDTIVNNVNNYNPQPVQFNPNDFSQHTYANTQQITRNNRELNKQDFTKENF